MPVFVFFRPGLRPAAVLPASAAAGPHHGGRFGHAGGSRGRTPARRPVGWRNRSGRLDGARDGHRRR